MVIVKVTNDHIIIIDREEVIADRILNHLHLTIIECIYMQMYIYIVVQCRKFLFLYFCGFYVYYYYSVMWICVHRII